MTSVHKPQPPAAAAIIIDVGVCEAAPMTDVIRILSAIEQGAPPAAEKLLPLVYEELRKLAAAQACHRDARPNSSGNGSRAPGVHPAGGCGEGPALEQPGHFFGAAAEAMRRTLVEMITDGNRSHEREITRPFAGSEQVCRLCRRSCL